MSGEKKVIVTYIEDKSVKVYPTVTSFLKNEHINTNTFSRHIRNYGSYKNDVLIARIKDCT